MIKGGYNSSINNSEVPLVEIILYTVVGIALYFFSDFILVQAEFWRGKPFENRNIIFFVIISVLAISSFQLINYLIVR